MYGGICVLGFIYLFRRLPETKGKTLEQLERDLVLNRPGRAGHDEKQAFPAKNGPCCPPPGHQIPQIAKAVENRPASGQNEVQEAIRPSGASFRILLPGRAAMGYRTLRDCVLDLRATGQLIVIDDEVDPKLEMAEVQRRLFRAGGPAALFINPTGCTFPMLGNLFGTMRADAVPVSRHAGDGPPAGGLAGRSVGSAAAAAALPEGAVDGAGMRGRGGSARGRCWPADHIDQLPQLKSWPGDGGAYITLPQVYTEDPEQPGLEHSNLGMYRVQLRRRTIRAESRSRPALPDSIAASACTMPRPSAARSGCG